ncbi:MAG: hypothetical protein ACI4SB_00580 [Acutalibacteraceae bacterium]
MSLNVSAYSETDDTYSLQVNDSLFSSVDNSTRDILEQFGIDDYKNAYNASFSNLVDYFSTNLKEKSTDAVKCFFMLFLVTVLIASVKTLASESENLDAFELLSVTVASLIGINYLYPAINSMISVLASSGNFIKAYIPIFAGIIAASGKPASALTYNTLTLAAAEIMSAVSNSYALYIIGAFISLSIAFSFNNNIDIERFNRAFSKTVSIVFGFFSGVFASALTLKGTISVAVDSTSVKSVRYLISSMIPVVGSSISEAYSSILGSIGLIKGSAAVIGIFSILIINIPAIAQGILYYLVMNILSAVGIALDCKRLSGLFGCLSCAVKFILLLIIFEVFLLVISTGLMLSFRE